VERTRHEPLICIKRQAVAEAKTTWLNKIATLRQKILRGTAPERLEPVLPGASPPTGLEQTPGVWGEKDSWIALADLKTMAAFLPD